MTARLVAISEELRRHIAGGEYSISFVDVRRLWVPIFERAKIGTACLVQVVPDEISTSQFITRSPAVFHEVQLSVFVNRAVDPSKLETVDECIEFTEQVYSRITSLREIEIPDGRSFNLTGAEFSPMVDIARMLDQRVYLGRIEVTYSDLNR
jgi:hypothetical protein